MSNIRLGRGHCCRFGGVWRMNVWALKYRESISKEKFVREGLVSGGEELSSENSYRHMRGMVKASPTHIVYISLISVNLPNYLLEKTENTHYLCRNGQLSTYARPLCLFTQYYNLCTICFARFTTPQHATRIPTDTTLGLPVAFASVQCISCQRHPIESTVSCRIRAYV